MPSKFIDTQYCLKVLHNILSNLFTLMYRFCHSGRTKECSDGLQREGNARNGTPQDPSRTVLPLETVDKTHEGIFRSVYATL